MKRTTVMGVGAKREGERGEQARVSRAGESHKEGIKVTRE